MFALRRGFATAAARSLQAPSKVVCVGRNYARANHTDDFCSDHISELSSARPKQPFFFLKPPSSVLLPGAGPVVRPNGVDLHYEVELALVIGKTLRNLEASEETAALAAIESYLLTIDLTARNIQGEAKKKGLPWDIAKGFDTFLPISRTIAKSAIPDPHNVELFLQVNGQTKQAASTNLMLFQIPRLLSDISKVMTLTPGDIVLTGTPAGVGPVVGGDVMRCGLKVDGRELEAAKIEVSVEDSTSTYVYAET
ncbi:putative hydrolase C21C3.09c [Ceratocystis fimbriata CBS 114723]|uniref:Putative hydrolase C21C3.09c n=1 Tax=Ceratocystis fimbriata CBS 114723 TaxID=1035309 RepID=A0A2C5X4X8_9PEZI|nr:putative hydrolase C21C3.09c [Ceratocystis fimbriata CBS 114723]